MPCPLCDDTGWKPIEDNGHSTGVRRVARCDCWRENLGQRRLVAANIPKRYQHCTIANFTAYNESLERAAGARRMAEAFPVVSKGLLLEGQPGVGKTHLAVAVLRQVVETTGARGLFYDTRDLLRVIRSTYDPAIRTTELEILRPVMTADLLVLDDLGAEKTSEWVEETMNLIVNTRYSERRLTMFTSNYEDNPDETEPNSLIFRIGHRMRSRLHEMCDLSYSTPPITETGPRTPGQTTSSPCGRCEKSHFRLRAGPGARPVHNSASPQRATAAPDLKWQEAGRAADASTISRFVTRRLSIESTIQG